MASGEPKQTSYPLPSKALFLVVFYSPLATHHFFKGFSMSSGGFSASALVCPMDQSTILLAIVAKLRNDISEFSGESICFISDIPWPAVEVQDNLFCTVCPASAEFMGKEPIGAGSLGIIEKGIFQVTVWSRLMTDQLEHSVLAFTDATRGLLTIKKQVLKSLAGQQLFSDAPTNARPLLTQWLRPVHAMHPTTKPAKGDFASFSLVFEGPFIWDLT